MSGKLIIIEGPDECGKSTLSRILARALNGVILHSTASKTLFPALPDYHRNIMANVELNVGELNKTIILDRFWPSEWSYGKLLRPETHKSYDEVADELHKRILNHKYLYIFAFSRNGWSRYAEGHVDPAHSLTGDQYREIWKNYETLYGMLINMDSNVLMYVLEDDGMEDDSISVFVSRVRKYLEL